MTTLSNTEILAELCKPFFVHQVKFRPGQFDADEGFAEALAYVEARDVMDRLDEVLGIGGWESALEACPSKNGLAMICRLTIHLPDGRSITRADTGVGRWEEAEKGAASDALKRAAVQFGIGRYLYRLDKCWMPYDEIQKEFVEVPVLPDFAVREDDPVLQPVGDDDSAEHEQGEPTEPEVRPGNRANAHPSQRGGEPEPDESFNSFGDEADLGGGAEEQGHLHEEVPLDAYDNPGQSSGSLRDEFRGGNGGGAKRWGR